MSGMLPIQSGALLTVTTGEYSDYCVRGVFRALTDIDAGKVRGEYLSGRPEQREANSFDGDGFLSFIAAKGLIEPVDCFEWHLCDYGNSDEMEVWKFD